MTYIRELENKAMLCRCIRSIQNTHPLLPIRVIDDNSRFPVTEGDIREFSNVTLDQNTFYPGCGEIYPYIYNLRHSDPFDNYVTLHDSMVMIDTIPDDCWSRSILPLWHFSPNVCKMSTRVKISDLCKVIKNGDIVQNVYDNHGGNWVRAHNRKRWYGMFGVSCICQNTVVKELFTQYDLEKIYPLVNCRYMRSVCERLWGVLRYLSSTSIDLPVSLNGNIYHNPRAYKSDTGTRGSDDPQPRRQMCRQYASKTWLSR